MSSVSESWGERHRRLSDRLAIIPAVANSDGGDADEPATLAHALLDIERVCKEVSSDLLPRVYDPAASDEAIAQTLLELGEAFRHLIYHLRDPRFYRYLPGCEDGNPT